MTGAAGGEVYWDVCVQGKGLVKGEREVVEMNREERERARKGRE